MYFLRLPGFNPKSGISTDNHSRFPFISALNGLFEPAPVFFKYDIDFPFEQLITDDQQIFYVSETNLIKIFKNNVSNKNEILLENITPITQEYTNELIKLFYKGYLAGFENFNFEIGPAFPSLSLAQQKEALEQLMDYCQRNLYFEGFAIPDLMHNLGYIQSCLVQAFKEHRNLTKLTELSGDTDFLKRQTDKSSVQTSVANNKTDIQKIPIKYPASDIKTIWLALLDLPKSKSLNLQREFKEELNVIELLGTMFIDISGEAAIFPDSAQHFYELSLDYQPVLYLLMHATYKLNYTYTRLPLDEYSKCLKATFSVFDAIELNHMPGNFTKKQALAISVLKELTDSSYVKNALQILAKIPSYRITL